MGAAAFHVAWGYQLATQVPPCDQRQGEGQKPGADGDECGADEQKCAIYQRNDFADFCEMVWNRIPRLLRVAISLIYEAAILKLISIFLGL